ncbi:MAG: glycosyltransferase family 2 protein [Muribaculaceae bacterium]|nr:glycosyltransferase family 2 protein [Muribaculaceae bacterium]
MDNNAKVTFIIPAYNVEKYLPRAVESVLAQTVENWEMIIIDDCSKDRTADIAWRYAAEDSRIRCILLDSQSGGAYVPRKRGITEALTEIVAPLDADDEIEKDYLERLLKTMSETGADAVYPIMYDWDGRTAALLMSPDPAVIGKTMPGKEAVKYTLDGWRIHCNGGLIKRSAYLRSFDMIDERKIERRAYLDEYLTRILLYNCEKVTITPVKYLYRENPDSVTKIMDLRKFSFLENNLRLLTFAKALYPEGSEESVRAQCQNFYGLIRAARLMRDIELSEEDREKLERMLISCRAEVDWKAIKGRVSDRYYRLMRMPEWISEKLLYAIDFFKGRT